jgi:hypothetical protein
LGRIYGELRQKPQQRRCCLPRLLWASQAGFLRLQFYQALLVEGAQGFFEDLFADAQAAVHVIGQAFVAEGQAAVGALFEGGEH